MTYGVDTDNYEWTGLEDWVPEPPREYFVYDIVETVLLGVAFIGSAVFCFMSHRAGPRHEEIVRPYLYSKVGLLLFSFGCFVRCVAMVLRVFVARPPTDLVGQSSIWDMWYGCIHLNEIGDWIVCLCECVFLATLASFDHGVTKLHTGSSVGTKESRVVRFITYGVAGVMSVLYTITFAIVTYLNVLVFTPSFVVGYGYGAYPGLEHAGMIVRMVFRCFSMAAALTLIVRSVIVIVRARNAAAMHGSAITAARFITAAAVVYLVRAVFGAYDVGQTVALEDGGRLFNETAGRHMFVLRVIFAYYPLLAALMLVFFMAKSDLGATWWKSEDEAKDEMEDETKGEDA